MHDYLLSSRVLGGSAKHLSYLDELKNCCSWYNSDPSSLFMDYKQSYYGPSLATTTASKKHYLHMFPDSDNLDELLNMDQVAASANSFVIFLKSH